MNKTYNELKKADKMYVSKYAEKHNLSVDEAMSHAIVKNYIEFREAEKNGRNKVDKD